MRRGDFAPAMATGILAVGARVEGVPALAAVLGALAAAVWAALTLQALRGRAGRAAAPAGGPDPAPSAGDAALTAAAPAHAISERGPAPAASAGAPAHAISERLTRFGFVAATGVLASWASGAREVLGALAALAWIALLARALPALAGTAPRDLVAAARGSWLLPAVATQSLAIVAAYEHAAAAGVALLGVGLAAYAAVAGLLAARRPQAADVTPDWWIVMGALAISTLAAAHLLAPAALVLWIGATAAIAPLVAADLARARRLGARYEPERWATVFPLGMYAVATHAVGARLHLHALLPLSTAAFAVALIAWAATAVATVRR